MLRQTIYYDLGDREWNIVKITADGWNIVSHDAPIFRRFQNTREQVQPSSTGCESFKKLFKHLNIREPDRILILVTVASYIIPDIPHPIIYPFGEHGMAKTTTCRMIKEVVDPGIPDVLSMPEDQRELVQQFYHHYVVFYDNISKLKD